MSNGYTLDEFIHDMNALVDSGADQAAIFDRGASWLEHLIRDPEGIPPEYRVPCGKGPRPNHGSYLLARSPNGLLVTAVVWGPGDHTGPHDHHTWGMIGVMNNTLYPHQLEGWSAQRKGRAEAGRPKIAPACSGHRAT
jgi:predicted metal-dependent enzyme (double-stranded beta helix superfamily)